MKLIAPNNIFSTILLLSIPSDIRPDIIIKESSLITSELFNNSDSIALIPSVDLINNRDLFVSEKFAIKFEDLISNSYLSFTKNNGDLDKLFLKGDVSSNEVILTKIIFEENYNIQLKVELDTTKKYDENKNYLVVGNNNWLDGRYKRYISFAEQIFDLLNYPYVNYLLVSNNKELLTEVNASIDNIDDLVDKNLDSILEKTDLGDNINSFIKSNRSSFDYNMLEDGKVSLHEQVKLLYYHQVIDDIFDIKFIP